jgi:hypothetical protein
MIGLGLFFLIGQTAHGRFLHGALLVPILLIGLGVWTFLQRTAFGHLPQQDSVLYRWQLISAGRRSGLLILVGIVFLLHQLHVARWFSVWPLFLIYFGLWALAERFAIPPAPYPPYSAAQPEASAPAATTNTGTSIVSTSPYRESHDTDTEEGR